MAMDNKTLSMIMALGGGNGGGGKLIPVPTAQDVGKMIIVVATQDGAGYQLVAFDEPMKFKGTLGTGGTITTLPAASSANNGYTYLVITDGTYAGQEADAGDQFISNGEAWWRVPSGDEASVIDDNITSTALTWSSDKLNGLFDDVKVKYEEWNGNGQTEKTITFPVTPKVILGIGNSKDNTLGATAPISYNFNKFLMGFIRTSGGNTSMFSSALTYNGNQMTITGSDASRAFNYLNETFRAYYI